MRAPSFPSSIDDEFLCVELAEMISFVADFLAEAEGPLLRTDFASFTSGAYTLAELRADLRRFAGWLGGEGFA